MIYPYLSYCVHVWGTAASTYLDKLHRLQKKILRIICGVPPKTSSEPLFDKMKVLTVFQIYKYSTCMFMYKLFHKQQPPIFDFFRLTSSIHDYDTRQANTIYLEFVPTIKSQKFIKISGTKLCNFIVKYINLNCAISTFKSKLKNLLLENYPK